MTGCERNRPKINVYYFRYANRSLNAHLYSEKCLNTAKYKITRQRVARRSWLFAENMPPSPLFTKIKIHTLLLLLFKCFSFYFWQLHLLSQCYPTLTFLTFKQFLKSKKLQGHVVAHSSMTQSCSAKTGQNLRRVLNSRDRCYAAKCNNIDSKCNKIFNAKCNNLSTQIVITFLTHNVITQNVIISEITTSMLFQNRYCGSVISS